ncbi:MAG TPA: T9SS type A sorting domain-containing protein, partial [Rubricoccaceae bacterium]|nr:T9SS type A sorting domain-containing protein [Rubricoccaceae bacterium]
EPRPEPEREGLGLEVRPNPFRGKATVTLTLARPSEVEVAVYDVLGRRVAVLAGGVYGAGRHVLTLDGTDLPAGVYVVRASAGGVVAAHTVTLLR